MPIPPVSPKHRVKGPRLPLVTKKPKRPITPLVTHVTDGPPDRVVTRPAPVDPPRPPEPTPDAAEPTPQAVTRVEGGEVITPPKRNASIVEHLRYETKNGRELAGVLLQYARGELESSAADRINAAKYLFERIHGKTPVENKEGLAVSTQVTAELATELVRRLTLATAVRPPGGDGVVG